MVSCCDTLGIDKLPQCLFGTGMLYLWWVFYQAHLYAFMLGCVQVMLY